MTSSRCPPFDWRSIIAEFEASLERTDHLVGEVDRKKWQGLLGLPFEENSHILKALGWLLWPSFCKSAVGSVSDAVAAHETGFSGNANWPQRYREIWRREQGVHANLLREVRGNPFRPVAFDPAWRTSDVLAIARQCYDSRDFSSLPILADALQDAGCDLDELLAHLRSEAEHVRGCWALDLVLDKS